MSAYDNYKHLLGLPYISGSQDCYGLARRYYKDVWDVELVNAARPDDWWNDPELDLLNDFMYADSWQQVGVNPRLVKPGDGLVFSLISGRANHVGVYVGNGLFIHHVYRRYSCEDPLLQNWTSRLLQIVRHEEVTKKREAATAQVDFQTLLPNYVKRKLDLPS